MAVLITDIQTEEKFDFDPEKVAEGVIEEVLRQEQFPEEAEVSLVVTDEEEVHRLNLEFRGIDRTTDVLSFPALDFESPSDFDCIDETCYDPDRRCGSRRRSTGTVRCGSSPSLWHTVCFTFAAMTT